MRAISFNFFFVLVFTGTMGKIPGQLKPWITEHPVNTTVSRSDSTRLECKVVGNPKPVITWYKDGIEIKRSSENRRSHPSVVLLSGALFFPRVVHRKNETDGGVYWCVARNEYGVAISHSAQLTIMYLQPEIGISPQSLHALVGEEATFYCDPPKGQPEPVVTWGKDGELLYFKEEPWRYRVNSTVLTIISVTPSDSGLYQCAASNIAGLRESISVVLTVTDLKLQEELGRREHSHVTNTSLDIVTRARPSGLGRRLVSPPIGITPASCTVPPGGNDKCAADDALGQCSYTSTGNLICICSTGYTATESTSSPYFAYCRADSPCTTVSVGVTGNANCLAQGYICHAVADISETPLTQRWTCGPEMTYCRIRGGASDMNPCNDDGDSAATCTSTSQTELTCTCVGTNYVFDGDSKCINPCKVADSGDSNPCNTVDSSATCTAVSSSSYICTCSSGYYSSGITCLDIDECTESTVCGNGTCTNVAGTYSCACSKGYQACSDQKFCTDIDECSIGICSLDGDTGAACYNTLGSYTCICSGNFLIASDNLVCRLPVDLSGLRNAIGSILSIAITPVALPALFLFNLVSTVLRAAPTIVGTNRFLDEPDSRIAKLVNVIATAINERENMPKDGPNSDQ